MARSSSTASKGVSLSRGPIGVLGLAGIVYGVLALIAGGNSFALSIPHGRVGDGHFLGLLTNGWTDLLFIAAGLLLTLAARGHRRAKSAATLVALVLGAAAIVAVIRGNGVFGLFAANGWTEIIWGAAAIVLAFLATVPRAGRGRGDGQATGGRAGSGAPAGDEATGEDPLVSTR